MTALRYVREQLAGALDLMLGRVGGLARLDVSLEGFWRSFAAVILLIPFAQLALLSQRRLVAADAPAAAAEPGAGLHLIVLCIDWVAFPLVFALLARPLKLTHRYVPFIVARNWAAVVIAAIVSVVHGLHAVGLLPSQLLGVLLIAAIGVSLRFSYMVARTTLGAPLGIALPIVLLDFLMSLVIWTIYDRLG